MPTKENSNRYFVPIILLVLTVYAVIVFFSFRLTNRETTAAAWVAHTHEVLFHTEKSLSVATEIETGSRAFLLTGIQQFLDAYEKSKREILQEISQLKELTADNLSQQYRIDSLLIHVNQRISFSDSIIKVRKVISLQAALQIVSAGGGRSYLNNMQRLVDQMQGEENRLLAKRKKDHAGAIAAEQGIFFAIALLMLVLIIISISKEKKRIEQKHQKISEDELKKSEENFRLLVSSVKDYAIFMLDKDGRVASWNSGAEHIKGYRAEEIIGKPLDLFYTDEEIQNGDPKKNLRLALENGHFETEGLRVRKDGSTFYANVVFTSLFDEEGKLSGYAKVTKDISQKRRVEEDLNNFNKELILSRKKIEQSEQRFRNVIEQAINPILILKGEDLKLELANEPLFKLWNVGKESIGKSFLEILPEMKGQPFVELLLDVLRNGSTHYGNEQPADFVRENGEKETVYFNFVYLPYREIDGSVSGVMVQATDVSAQVIARKKVETSETNLFNANKELSFQNEEKEKRGAELLIANDQLIKTKGELSKLNIELEQRVKDRTEEISKNEKRFRALVENNYDIISLLDESLRIIYRSPSATRILGWSNEEMKDLDGFKNIHPDDRKMAGRVIQESMENPGKPVKVLFRRLHKQGHYISIEGVITNLLHDEDVKAIVFNFRDVTEQIEAKEKLAASESWFRAIIENSAEAIALTDEYSNNIYRSPAAQKIMGDVPEENMTSLSHPDDLAMIKNKHAEALKRPDVPIAFQGRFRHASGHYIWLEGTLTNLLHVNAVNALVANYRDITQRKEAEEKLVKSEKIYKTIASSIPGSVICLLDSDYRYLLIEGDMLEKLGYSKNNLLGKKACDVLPPAIFESVKKEFERVFNGETITRESSTNGYDVVSRFIPLKDEDNIVYVIMTVAIDITTLKKAQRDITELNRGLEEKIINRTEQLKKTNEEMESFSYSVSHDLRAPLRAIIGFTNILEEDYSSRLDDEAKRITSIIKNSTTKMGHLIDDLLTFSRMGRQDIIKTPVDSNIVVDEIINGTAQGKAISSIEWIIHSLPLIKGDLNMLRQVWTNLISNAIKYSGQIAKPRIEIGSFIKNGQAVFFVKDNGVGFDEKYKSKLFGVFQRLHNAEEFEGTGIGLAIVEKIVSKHGGIVWAEAEPGKGATFHFSLPSDDDKRM